MNVGEKWLQKHGLEGDSLASILLDYCGLRNNKISVDIVESDLGDGRIAICISFPGTDITKVVMVNIGNIDFVYDEALPWGIIMADLGVKDYEDEFVSISIDDSPDYDSELETPLEGVDWDNAVRLLTYTLNMSKKTRDKIFPPKN
jgi:hypothetical protein